MDSSGTKIQKKTKKEMKEKFFLYLCPQDETDKLLSLRLNGL